MEFNLLCVIVGVAALLVGVVADSVYRKNVSEKKLGSAEEEAKRILNEAIKTAESKQREAMVEAKEAILTQQKMEAELKVEEASKEIARCDCTITQLTEKVDVNDMRQTLNDIVRNAPGETFGTAWQHLYREFQKKYHLNIYSRKNYEKYDNLLDYIDKELHMIPELYELACALYSVAYEKVKSRWERGTKSGNVSFASRVNR